uniref:Uncharacterized protein n=1 Tax=Alexandrium andersonii TaxID=327968 RepID=A0A7S2I8Z0_9DINO|eukprot:CAMPEP_0197414324 /NCGR_PEP_ID=MMETSP1170-20131217/1038_1 /TAXON_ID=54406 /ORGANISM="Sarcinochrysis sp, Strain CCMP770" /LENGTH=113 /DNA_ID=CAMNT_0042941029 /DNA_START=96 /DNA_END=437 /DNA_ORIENTATION=-
MRFLLALVCSIAAVSAFAPVPVTKQVTVARQAYVPDGLSAADWAKKQKEEKAKSAKNKQRFPKGKSFVDVTVWLKQLEGRQSFAGEKITGSGHTFAKTKFESKEAYDAAKGRK